MPMLPADCSRGGRALSTARSVGLAGSSAPQAKMAGALPCRPATGTWAAEARSALQLG
jgi:hypothetical protein